MTSIYELKPAFQNLLRPFVRVLADRGVTPNQVTLAAALLCLLAGAVIVLYSRVAWPLLLIPSVLFVRMALNAIDGMLAREHRMQTPLGTFLNELGDGVSDTALYLPLALVPGVSAPLIVIAVVLALISELTGVVAVQIGARRRYDGPMGKSDRAVCFGGLALALGSGLAPGLWVDILLFGVIGLSVLTCFNRARQALREAA